MFQETGRIRLKLATLEDLDFICGLESEKENAQYIIPWTKGKHKMSLTDKDLIHVIIEEKTSNQAIGFIILAGLMNENKCIELTRIIIANKGKGYGKEAFKIIKEWVFTFKKANRLWLDVKVNNIRAINLYKQQGFIHEGTLRECLKNEHGFESLHIMSILRREYVTL